MKTFLLFPTYFRPSPQAFAASLFHGAKNEIEDKTNHHHHPLFTHDKNFKAKCFELGVCADRWPRNQYFCRSLPENVQIIKLPLSSGLNDKTCSTNIVFVTENVWWLNRKTMFDQTLIKVSPYNAFCVFLLKINVHVTQFPFLNCCFSRSSKASYAVV